ncbi:MAG: alpha/beta hydrolase [Pseudomonadota bacterium]
MNIMPGLIDDVGTGATRPVEHSEIEKAIGLEFSLESVFSLLPDETAIQARQASLGSYLEGGGNLSGTIKWAEFDFDGRFQRGGVALLGEQSSRIFNVPDDDPVLRLMADRARKLELRPGLIDSLPNEDHMFWFIPYTPPSRDRVPKTLLRGLSITQELFSQLVDQFNASAALTQAEKRVCFQFLSGKNLRDAAEADNVSVETKRIQIKAAIGKLECTGQADLARLLVGQLVHLVYMSEGESNFLHLAESFAAAHFPQDVRISVQRLRNGRLLRFFEAGPAGGTPVLMVHGFMFPFAPINAPRHLEEHNIRLMIPIRAGYLDERSGTNLYRDENAVEQSIADLIQYVEDCWKGPITVMGEMIGNPVAVLLAARRPDLVNRLIIYCINTAPGDTVSQTFSQRFHGGLRSLIARPSMFRFLSWQFRTFNKSVKTMRTSTMRIVGDCKADQDALEGRVGAGPVYKWMLDLLRDSPVGIADDFHAVVSEKWVEALPALTIPVDFIHGSDCAMTSLDEARSLAATTPGASVQVLDGAGHYAHGSHPELVWQTVRDLVDG